MIATPRQPPTRIPQSGIPRPATAGGTVLPPRSTRGRRRGVQLVLALLLLLGHYLPHAARRLEVLGEDVDGDADDEQRADDTQNHQPVFAHEEEHALAVEDRERALDRVAQGPRHHHREDETPARAFERAGGGDE